MEKRNIFKNAELFGNIFNEICSSEKYCDFIIRTKDQENIKVHKMILEAASPYFKALFNADMREKKEGAVTFLEIDSGILRQILEYMYTGIIEINDDNAQLLLAASHLFQIDWIVELCSEYLKESVNISSWLTIRKFADLYSCKGLLEYCRDYMIEHFEELALESFLLEMSYEECKDIISRDYLGVESEEIIYKTVIDWIKHDVDNRKMYFTELMSYVRFPLIEEKFLLKYCLNEPLFCPQLITAVKNQLYPEGEHDPNIVRTRHRRSRTNIFIVGETCQMFDSYWNNISIPNFEITKISTCAVTVNKKIYTFGFNGRSICGELFDPLTNKWSDLPAMNANHFHSRSKLQMNACVLEHMIYVCVCRDQIENSLYVYNTEVSKWNEGPSMPFSCDTKSVVVQNAIYYFGESVAYRFDPREWNGAQCKSLTGLSTKRSDFCVVSDKTYVYCIGGKDSNNVLATVERYDVRNNKWELLADILFPRFEHAAVIKDDYIHVLGGRATRYGMNNDDMNNYECVPTEIYKPVRNKWTVLDNVNIKCLQASAVTLKRD